MVYNFLERPSGKVPLCYHALVFCFVFMCLALSVFATIEEHEDEAGEMLYYLEIVIVVWFGVEFFVRNPSSDLAGGKIDEFGGTWWDLPYKYKFSTLQIECSGGGILRLYYFP